MLKIGGTETVVIRHVTIHRGMVGIGVFHRLVP